MYQNLFVACHFNRLYKETAKSSASQHKLVNSPEKNTSREEWQTSQFEGISSGGTAKLDIISNNQPMIQTFVTPIKGHQKHPQTLKYCRQKSPSLAPS